MISGVFIIDDEKMITDSYAIFMKRSGITDYTIYNDPREFAGNIDNINPMIVFVDLQMPYHTGEELLELIKKKHPAASVIIVTGNNDVSTAVRCIHKGALNFLVKPLDSERFAAAYHAAVNANQMHMEINALRSAMRFEENPDVADFHGIITSDGKMKEVFRYIESVSKSSFPVLITGETGVGKELFARAVHECSLRKGLFAPVNVAGLDDTMFSDTLFGHVKGAFTGADKPRQGFVAAAEGGTLFLDEIGDMAESAQVKLLRLLQEKVYSPLGSDKYITANVRIVAATNAGLEERVQAGKFRQDLFYRLTTHRIEIPPLRDRAGDIEHLALMFYNKALKEVGMERADHLPAYIIRTLKNCDFQGNVRQLQAVMSDMAMVFSGRKPSECDAAAFFSRHGIRSASAQGSSGHTFSYFGDFPTLKEIEHYTVEYALKESDGNISSAAKLLGITRQALHKRLKAD
ncbi:sigma-54 dependent transcriptional regulator [Seleniivibrio woodruffii]|uniref:sigma-54-dependent transcriptional regulator n=1 Tax=Seleniivibrio woodruffii TaxID=1078050 RepID=UPI0026EC8ADB|nr:sigma-54 dependent transcriptional regulator [Seleniivibrio woodruffii]